MGFSNTTTGATGESSIVRGNIGLVSGTYSASAGTADIITGGSAIIAHGIGVTSWVGAPTGGSATIPLNKSNVDGKSTVKAGSIGLTLIDTGVEVGDWWAIVKLAI